MINIILADDHGIVRDGIKATLRDEKNFKIIAEASNGIEAIQKVEQYEPDILIIDITMPEMNGIDAAAQIHKTNPHTRSIILSMHDREEYVFKAIESGASGYLLKDTGKEEFIKAINLVYKGEKYFSSSISNVIVSGYLHKIKNKENPPAESDSLLTKREKGILKLIVDGLNNRAIADQLKISVRTIETHRSNIMKKMQVKNAIELVKIALEQKLF